MVALRE